MKRQLLTITWTVDFTKLNRFVRKGLFLLLLSLFVFTWGGCKKWLDIEPSGELIEANFWKTEAQATGIVSGCYRSMCEDDYMQRIILWGEGRSDNVMTLFNEDSYIRMVNIDLTSDNGYCTWAPFYRVINRCNTFLDKAPDVMIADPNFTKEDYNSLEAEVLAIRALNYFYLVKAFRNVPWKETSSSSDDEDFNIAQSSDTFVIARIITDLEKAYINAPSGYFDGERNNYNRGRITKNAILAILADVYLWDKQYEKCVQKCNLIIDSKKYSLPDYEDLLDVFYLGNSKESIFELQFGDGSGNELYNYLVYSSYFLGPKLVFSDFLVPGKPTSPFNYSGVSVVESAEDVRYKDYVNNSVSGIYMIFKYIGEQRVENVSTGKSTYFYDVSSPNWIIYRLADILLMKAEALVQLNRNQHDLTEALAMVNSTYLRANPKLEGDSLKIENYSNPADLSKLVLRERQREFLFEGKRYYDLMRYAIRENSPSTLVDFVAEKRKSSTTQIGPQSLIDAIYLPVNIGVLKRSPNLKQNPYYETSEGGVVGQ